MNDILKKLILRSKIGKSIKLKGHSSNVKYSSRLYKLLHDTIYHTVLQGKHIILKQNVTVHGELTDMPATPISKCKRTGSGLQFVICHATCSEVAYPNLTKIVIAPPLWCQNTLHRPTETRYSPSSCSTHSPQTHTHITANLQYDSCSPQVCRISTVSVCYRPGQPPL